MASLSDGLIGHTGFVGGQLARDHEFAHRYNSSNVASIDGQAFGTLVCAAAPGSMVAANGAPNDDAAAIDALVDRLRATRAERFVLVSTIAVLGDWGGGLDEGTQDFETDKAYGRHRRALEVACAAHFDRCLIVRLPALYGEGLRKNFLFDLANPVPSLLKEPAWDELVATLPDGLRKTLTDAFAAPGAAGWARLDRAALNAHPGRTALEAELRATARCSLRFHHPDTQLQCYGIDRLWRDIHLALDAGIGTLHAAPEQLKVADIYRAITGNEMPTSAAAPHVEDMHSRHAGLWDRPVPYIEGADSVLTRLKAFMARDGA
ncbi:NAD-dependent epimerase/dehydratase family protein [Sphingomicrobium sp. XHP0239]|uniref:NAD-dependent epimerase/dehydratase family protein n=1 Tax=Sphingomicrobium maritimum TaxID=3133972 RepID=UPI0031CC4E58